MKKKNKFPLDFYQFLEENTLIGIKGGKTRTTFLKIWMVTVDGKVFARSWNKSEKSWFTEFQKSGCGQIEYDNKIINVKGRKLKKSDFMNKSIDKAYIEKYTQPKNLKYVEGITQPEYANYTMEFFL